MVRLPFPKYFDSTGKGQNTDSVQIVVHFFGWLWNMALTYESKSCSRGKGNGRPIVDTVNTLTKPD